MLGNNWQELLIRINNTILTDKEVVRLMGNPETLFYPSVSKDQLDEAEKRLGVKLPFSYKQFLLVSNGFKILSNFYWNILPVENIQWLKDFDSGLIETYINPSPDVTYPNVSDEEYFVYGEKQNSTSIRPEYLNNCLVISGWGDASLLLLNPEIKYNEEWEAWAFANWYPGAYRFKSFWELVNEEFNAYVELKNK